MKRFYKNAVCEIIKSVLQRNIYRTGNESSQRDFPRERNRKIAYRKKACISTQHVDVCYYEGNRGRSILQILKDPKVFTADWINLRPVVEIINLSKFLARVANFLNIILIDSQIQLRPRF